MHKQHQLQRLNYPIFLVLTVLINYLVIGIQWQNIYVTHDLTDALYNSKLILNGKVPYRDFFHNHFVGYMYVFAFIDYVVGMQPSVVAAVQIVSHSAFCIFISLTVLNLTGSYSKAKWAALLAATIGWSPEIGGFGFYCQSYVLPLFGMYLCLVSRALSNYSRPRIFYSALTYSLAVTFDQRALTLFPLLLIPIIKNRDLSPRFLFKLSIVSALIPLLCGTALIFANAFPEFVEQTLLFQLKNRNAKVNLYNVVEHVLIQIISRPDLLIGVTGLFFLLFSDINKWIKVFSIFLFSLSLIMVLGGGRAYLNYFIFLVPATILFSALTEFEISLGKRSVKLLTPVFLGLLIFFLFSLMQVAQRHELIRSDSVVIRASDQIENITNEGDEILIWGYCPQIYLYSKRFTSFADQSLITFAAANFHLSPPHPDNVLNSYRDDFNNYLYLHPPKVVLAKLATNSNIFDYYRECIFGNQELEKQSGNYFFNEWLNKNYMLHSKVSDQSIELGLFVRRTNL